MKKFAEPGRQKQGAKVGTALCSAMYGKGGEGACLLSIRAYAPDMQRERERLRASGGLHAEGRLSSGAQPRGSRPEAVCGCGYGCGRAIYALYEQAGSLMRVLWPCRRAYRRAIARRRPHLGYRGPFGAVNLHRLHDKSVFFRRRPFQIEVGVQVVGPPVCS